MTFTRAIWLILLIVVGLVAWDLWRAQRLPGVPRRQRWFTVLRPAALALLALALAGAQSTRPGRGVDLLFLLDASDSIGPEVRQRALEWVRQAAAKAGAADRAGLIVFGKQALTEVSLTHHLVVDEIRSQVDGSATDLEGALRLALGTFSPTAAPRIVLLSDGAETVGRVDNVLPDLRRRGVAVDVYPLRTPIEHEVILERLSVPTQVARNETFSARVVVSSARATPAVLRLFRNGELIGDRPVNLKPGRNLYEFVGLRESGDFATYEAQVEAPQDRFRQNNTAYGLVSTQMATRFLLLAGDPVAAEPLYQALRAQGLPVELKAAGAAPTTVTELERYSAVILQDVPALSLSERQMSLLAHYVRDLGGGLVAIGGRHSFGLGGYYDTPLEDALPLAMDTPNQLVVPSLALVMVIDRSGSMAETQGGFSKLDLAKEAALGVLDVLHDRDLVGVLTFESDYSWTVPLQSAADRQLFAAEIASLQADGGTDMGPAMAEAGKRLANVQAMVKHLIVLSDGRSKEADFEALTRSLAQQNITVTTVAIGQDADRPLMERIAAIGRGRFYYTDDIRAIPQIFATEALVVSRSLAVDQRFSAAPGQPADFLKGFPADALPPLDGYVVTTAKTTATVHLYATDQNPLLASWRYGLGRSVAFTSAVTPPWGSSWVRWPRVGAFWAQVLRWVMRPQGAEGLNAALELSGAQGRIVVDVIDDQGQFVNFLNLRANVVRPDGSSATVRLRQSAPGHYEGTFAADSEGVYIAAVADPSHPRYAAPRVTGGVIPYSAEYLVLSAPEGILTRLARETGGRMLRGDEPLFIPSPLSRAERPLWGLLLTLALLLFLADMAVRYLPDDARAAIHTWYQEARGRVSPSWQRWRLRLAAGRRRADVDAFLARRRQAEHDPDDLYRRPQRPIRPDRF